MGNMLIKTVFASALVVTPLLAQTFGVVMDISYVPERKQTHSSNYLSSAVANEMVMANPGIFFVDVRGPKEVARVGHPANIDAIVPVKVEGPDFDEVLKEHILVENPDFVEKMQLALSKADRGLHDMVIVICGSGVRSALAVRELEEHGFTNVWHIPDGYDGDDKPGLNTQNAWKNAQLPWSETLTAEVY